MKRVFLIGCPIRHSLSPAIQHAALQAAGLDWRYELLKVEKPGLPKAVAELRADECAGANVTIPHKGDVGQWLDELALNQPDAMSNADIIVNGTPAGNLENETSRRCRW